MIRAAQPLGACPGGRAPRQNWGKFEAHKWGGFTGRLDDVVPKSISNELLITASMPGPSGECSIEIDIDYHATEVK
jgi:hypothetical protein